MSTRKARKKAHSKPPKRKPKGDYVCNWCWTKFKTQEDIGYNTLGGPDKRLCVPCGQLYVDMVLNKNKPEKSKEIQERMKNKPGLDKFICDEIEKRTTEVHTFPDFRMTIFKLH